MPSARSTLSPALGGSASSSREAVLFKLGMSVIRVGFGLVFLTNGIAKLPGFPNRIPPLRGFTIDYEGISAIIRSDTSDHPVAAYKWFIDDVFLAHIDVFGPLVTGLELMLGLCLILGVFTPIAALLAFGFEMNLQFANIHREDKWLWEYAVSWMPLLGLALMRAGRYWGVDVVLARQFPRWPLT